MGRAPVALRVVPVDAPRRRFGRVPSQGPVPRHQRIHDKPANAAAEEQRATRRAVSRAGRVVSRDHDRDDGRRNRSGTQRQQRRRVGRVELCREIHDDALDTCRRRRHGEVHGEELVAARTARRVGFWPEERHAGARRARHGKRCALHNGVGDGALSVVYRKLWHEGRRWGLRVERRRLRRRLRHRRRARWRRLG